MSGADAINFFNEIVGKLDQPAKQIVEIYTKQIIAYGITDIVVGGLMLALATTLGVLAFKKRTQVNEYSITFTDWGSFLTVIFSIWGIMLTIKGWLMLYNPQFYLIQDIINGTIAR